MHMQMGLECVRLMNDDMRVNTFKACAIWSKIEKNRQNRDRINHCPTSEGVSEVSGASERTSE